MSKKFFNFACLAAVLYCVNLAAWAQSPYGPGKPVVKFASSQVKRAPRRAPAVTLHFQISPGFHVQAHHPNSAYLIPTKLELHPPAGIRIVHVFWPKPEALHLSFSRKPLLVYSGVLQLKVVFHGGKTAQPLRGVLHYQACTAELCQPPAAVAFQALLR